MGIRIMLNRAVRENYNFIDPEAPLVLDLSKPRGIAPRLTGSILRGLRGKTLIDIDNVVDLKTGAIKESILEQRADAEKKAILEKENAKKEAEEKAKADKEAKEKKETEDKAKADKKAAEAKTEAKEEPKKTKAKK